MSDQRGGGIAWTDVTWNPVRGCSRVSEGCRNCYAERVAARFAGPGRPFEGFAQVVAPRDDLDRVGGRRNGWTGRVELVPGKLAEPLRWRRPQRVFVNSMSDLFHERLRDGDIDRLFAVMALAQGHTFQVLTKRPERMRAYFSKGVANRIERAMLAGYRWTPADVDRVRAMPLANVWLGVSVEDQKTADARIPLLLETPAAVRWVSYEPALGPVGLERFLQYEPFHENYKMTLGSREWRGLDWVVVGGESGPGARPFDIAWARSARDQCREAGVAFFMKQCGTHAVVPACRQQHFDWRMVKRHESRIFTPEDGLHPSTGKWLIHFKDSHGGDPSEWPEDLRVREFPG